MPRGSLKPGATAASCAPGCSTSAPASSRTTNRSPASRRWWRTRAKAAGRRSSRSSSACRRLLKGVADARIVYLHAAKAVLAERVAKRKHKYMPASLLDSQLATLEPPTGAIDIDVSGEPEDSVEAIMQAL